MAGWMAADLGISINPINWLKAAAGWGAKQVSGSVADAIKSVILTPVAHLITSVVHGLLGLWDHSAGVELTGGWFAGADATAVWHTVVVIAATLMTALLLIATIHGMAQGDAAGIVRNLVAGTPGAVFGILATLTVGELLLRITDASSAAVLRSGTGSIDRLGQVFAAGVTATPLGLLCGLLFLVGALLLWVEQLIRGSFIYLLAMISPLLWAASVWPALAGLRRKFLELSVALIVSKFVAALALALAVAAMGDAPASAANAVHAHQQFWQNLDKGPAAALNALLVGAVLIFLAAFSPFVLLRLIPVVEGAAVAQGVSRGPTRAAQSISQSAYFGRSMVDRFSYGATQQTNALTTATSGSAGGGQDPPPAAPTPGGGGPPPGGGGASPQPDGADRSPTNPSSSDGPQPTGGGPGGAAPATATGGAAGAAEVGAGVVVVT